jgi:hypothetical protein
MSTIETNGPDNKNHSVKSSNKNQENFQMGNLVFLTEVGVN